MTKLEKMARQLNDNFRDCLTAAIGEKFSITTVTEYNFFADRLITKKVDESDFTPNQIQWISAFSDGYAAAKNQVVE